MNKKGLLIIALLFCVVLSAQEEGNKVLDCKVVLGKYYSVYKIDAATLQVKEEKLNVLLKEITAKTTLDDKDLKELQQKKDTVFILKQNLDSILNRYNRLREVCIENGALKKEKAAKIWDNSELVPYNLKEDTVVEPEAQEPVVYTYLSDDVVIANDVLGEQSDTPQGRALINALAKVNEKSYLGDITIPMENQDFKFYNNKFKQVKEEFKFKKIELEIKDGVFADIQILVEHNGKLLWFENKEGVSIISYSKRAKNNHMFFSHKNTDIIDEKNYENLRIRLSDVLSYKYKIGNNYIPRDLTLELPKMAINNEKGNKDAPALYQIKEDVSLDKIVEFRTYTDFLTLFGATEAANGLVQLEGKAKFYMNLGFYSMLDSQITLFKSISPYVNYSRFEEADRFVEANISENNSLAIINKPLDLIEKKFLTMGSDIKIADIFRKNGLFKFGLYADVNYNITKVKLDDESAAVENLKFFGYGGGIELSFKRFNNFGFNYRGGITWYDFENYNTSTIINTAIDVPVVNHNAEIYYNMPGGNNGQAVYVRLATYNYLGTNNDEAFYQLQFGYKFSIGSRVVSK